MPAFRQHAVAALGFRGLFVVILVASLLAPGARLACLQTRRVEREIG